MSRIADLVELIQSANDVYLANPERNVRFAYIQIDQLCELILKIWLQNNISGWNPVSHQRNGKDYYKGFNTLIQEIIQSTSGNTSLHTLLNEFQARRDKRNNFFHNQDLAGLTVQPKECLQAFCDLYQLMEMLFSNEYKIAVNKEPIIKTQIAIIRLKNHSSHIERILGHYRVILDNGEALTIGTNNSRYEYLILYDNPGALYERILRHFNELVGAWQTEIDRIDKLKRQTRKHKADRDRYSEEVNTVQDAIKKCLS